MKNLYFAGLVAVVLTISLVAVSTAHAEQAQTKTPSPALVLGMSLGLPALGYMVGVSAREQGAEEFTRFVVFTTLFVLPSAGQIVLGRWGQAALWTGIRVGAAAALVFAIVALSAGSEVIGLGLGIAAFNAYGVGVLGDLMSSYRAAGQARSNYVRGFALVPTRSPDGALGTRLGWTTNF